jgi:hypothetical protein
MIVASPRELLWAWLNERIDIPWSSDFRAIGLVKNDCLVAVAGYNCFAGRTCHTHIAILPGASVSKEFLKAGFEYPFEQCDLLRLYAWMDEADVQPLNLDLKLGFEIVHRVPNGAVSGADLLLIELKRENCRFLKGQNNEQWQGTSSARLPRSSGGDCGVKSSSYH